MNRELTLRGRVSEGFGEGGRYVTRNPYLKYFIKELGREPYPGTLNVSVEYGFEEIASVCPPTKVEFGPGVGPLLVWRGKILAEDGATINVLILRPLLSRHSPNVIEAVSPANLRESLGLRNGSMVTLKLVCGDADG